MDGSNSAVARRNDPPYRRAPDTALEVMLRNGAFAPVRRPWLREGLALTAGALAFSLAIFGVEAAGMLLRGIGLVVFVVACARSGGAFPSRSGSLAGLCARIESYPIPFTGHLDRWLDAGELWLGSFDLVFSQRHPSAEATVRLAEPEARLEWREPATLRVEPPWDRDGRDFSRLDRLVALLSMVRDELGLERIELGSTYRIVEPIVDG
jgi:hypothetical protein